WGQTPNPNLAPNCAPPTCSPTSDAPIKFNEPKKCPMGFTPMMTIKGDPNGLTAQIEQACIQSIYPRPLESPAQPLIYESAAIKTMVKDEPNGPRQTIWPSSEKFTKWCTKGEGFDAVDVCSDKPTYHAEYSCKDDSDFLNKNSGGLWRCLHVPRK